MEPSEIDKNQVDMWQVILTAIPAMIEDVVKDTEVARRLFDTLWSGPKTDESEAAEESEVTLLIVPIMRSILRLKYQEVLIHKLFIEEFKSSSEERDGIITLVEKTLLLNLVKNDILSVDDAKGIFHNSNIDEIVTTATKSDPENLKSALRSLEEFAEHQKKVEANPGYTS